MLKVRTQQGHLLSASQCLGTLLETVNGQGQESSEDFFTHMPGHLDWSNLKGSAQLAGAPAFLCPVCGTWASHSLEATI